MSGDLTDLTERVAGYVVTLQSGAHLNEHEMRLFGMDVLKLCQVAEAGASVQPTPLSLASAGEHESAWVTPLLAEGGVGLRVFTAPISARPAQGVILEGALGIEGALHLSGELKETAVAAQVLESRRRAARQEDLTQRQSPG